MNWDVGLWDILLGGVVFAAIVWAAKVCLSDKGRGRGCMGGCARCPRRAEGRCVWGGGKGK